MFQLTEAQRIAIEKTYESNQLLVVGSIALACIIVLGTSMLYAAGLF